MTGWPLVSLSDVFDIARGGSPRPIDSYITNAQDGINWITISDASKGSKYITQAKRRIRPEGAQRSRMVKPGDFLLTNSMSFGRPYIMRTSGCIHDGWLVLSPQRTDVDADFFYHLLGSNTLYAEFARLASGATVKNLNIDLVKSVSVPLPPLAEQRRIAGILDKANALRAKRRAVLAQLDSLAQSIFLDMFGDPLGNPKRWPSATLGEVAEVMTGFPFRSERYVFKSGIRLCRGANVLPDRIDWTDLACWPADNAGEYTAFRLNVGDIVLAMDRPWIAEGFKIAQVRARDTPALLVQRVARIRGRDRTHNDFLHQLLRHPIFARHTRPTETTIPHISPIELKSFGFPCPPIDLQLAFADRIRRLNAVIVEHESGMSLLDSLFASLQYRAFRGEL